MSLRARDVCPVVAGISPGCATSRAKRSRVRVGPACCRVASHGCLAAKMAFVGQGGSFRRVPGVRLRPDRRHCARRTLNRHDAKRHLWRTRIRGDKAAFDPLADRPHPLHAALDSPRDWRSVPHGGSRAKERYRAWLSRHNTERGDPSREFIRLAVYTLIVSKAWGVCEAMAARRQGLTASRGLC